jgi:hypothetical protein
MLDYADEIIDEEQERSDFEGASGYDDLDLPRDRGRRHRWKSKKS